MLYSILMGIIKVIRRFSFLLMEFSHENDVKSNEKF